MRVGRRSSTFTVTVISILAAVVAGAAIPLFSGNRLRTEPTSWTPAPATAAATATPTPAATETVVATATTAIAATSKPTATETSAPTSVAENSTAAAETRPDLDTEQPAAVVSPTLESAPATATPVTEAAEGGTPTANPEPPAAAETEETGPIAVIAAEQLNLRLAPSAEAIVMGLGIQGDRFPIVGRDSEGLWLQACCVADEPVWLSSGFVTVTGSLENVPIVP